MEKLIFIHYLITFLGEHSNVNNVINAFVLASMYRYSGVITCEIFWNFFWDRGVGGWGVSYPNFFLDFYIYFYIHKTPKYDVVRRV